MDRNFFLSADDGMPALYCMTDQMRVLTSSTLNSLSIPIFLNVSMRSSFFLSAIVILIYVRFHLLSVIWFQCLEWWNLQCFMGPV